MAPMRSSREMAVARASGNNRKRFGADSESDNDVDSDSDFSVTKIGGGRPQAKKKPRNATSTKTSATDSNKTGNSAAVTLTGIKLPKEMACPEGITPFSKAHWKAMVQTDEFWEYLNKMVPPSVLKTRLVASINHNLKAEQAQRQDAKEAKTRIRQPSAVKGGPVHLDFSARDGGIDPTQQHADTDADETAHPPTNPGQAESGGNQVQGNIDQVDRKEGVKGATRGTRGSLTLEQYNKLMEEQEKGMAQFGSTKAKEENEIKAEIQEVESGSQQSTSDPSTSLAK